ncbi:MAG: PqiC family protein [Pyrinomonadaceae bacterium]|nr:PqiC family protein [Pyrinomonadaceae bacterium]
MRYGYLWSAVVFLTISSLTGCGSSRETYYTLSAGAGGTGAIVASGESAYSVAVGPITLPEVVDRPQFVLRAGPNEVSIVELHRWAGPLKSEIPRVIADNLAADLNVKRVAAYPQSAGENANYRVLVDIQRFDSTMGESVTIDALWTVKRTSDGVLQTGRSTARESGSGGTYDAMVAAHSRALASISREIAEAIRSLSAPTQR